MIKKTQTSHNLSFFFFNDTATTEIYTLSLHDALPICLVQLAHELADELHLAALAFEIGDALGLGQGIGQLVGQLQALEQRSEEHTSELQSPCNLVCRLLLEKKTEHIARLIRALHRIGS